MLGMLLMTLKDFQTGLQQALQLRIARRRDQLGLERAVDRLVVGDLVLDVALGLDYPPLVDPKWRGLPGYMHYKANWLLIVDNLSDFAHLAFVHTNTLGGSEEYAYKTRPVALEKLNDGFRVERWHMNAEPPPYHRKVISNKTDRIDRRNIGRMIIPAIFTLDTTFAPAGQGAGKGVAVPGTGSSATRSS
jgi:Vanillate O-demethylase oxygenase C-terminal domain